MIVRTEDLIIGCITSEDIYSLTQFPIIKEKTVLTEEHINILKVFHIEHIKIEPVLSNGEKMTSKEWQFDVSNADVNKQTTTTTDKEFVYLYLQSVKDLKILYSNWQAGHKVEMVKVRSVFLPLFEKVIYHAEDLLTLHHYVNKEDYIIHHSVYVGILSAYIGYKLGYKKGDWLQIGFGGALADIGMSRMPPNIMTKIASLTPSEFEEIKKHPIYGYKMLKDVTGISDLVLLSVLQHHERLDGSGYPLGVDKRKIHAFSQIISVADVYHAMTSERFYRMKRSPFQVLDELVKENLGKFDIKATNILVENFLNISIGKHVRLTSGEKAEIVFINIKSPSKPIVRLLSNGEVIELAKEPTMQIIDFI